MEHEPAFFRHFRLTHIDVGAGTLRVRVGGSGPALLLLHATPQTHAMWHAVAARLADRFTVICPDLRGHGGSLKPSLGKQASGKPSLGNPGSGNPGSGTPFPGADHGARAMAGDLADLMSRLGHGRYAVAGQGRGAQVAHRLALSEPARVTHLTVLDMVPPAPRPRGDDMASAFAAYPGLWFFQPLPLDEQMMSLSSRAWFNDHGEAAPRAAAYLHPAALEDYLTAANDPAAVRSMTESYRAASGIDLVEASMLRASGARVVCPTDVLWAAHGHLGGWFDPRHSWQDFCQQRVNGAAIACGPLMAEEAPDDIAAWLARAGVKEEAAVA